MEFCAFDAEYIRRLNDGDPATEAHFATYFEKYLVVKLRARYVAADFAADVRQETLFRVLRALRQGPGLVQPERFGAFVNSVCDRVLLELRRKQTRHPLREDGAPEPADETVDLEASLVTEQRKKVVAAILAELPDRDREILRLVFYEEEDRQEVCRRMGVEPGYLRVLLHRAKSRFQDAFTRKHGKMRQVLGFFL